MSRRQAAAVASQPQPMPQQRQLSALQGLFEELGLTAYEARLLVALVQVGEATASQLARLSGISRPNVYLRLEALENRNLAEARPGKVTRWASPGAREVVNRLRVANHEQLTRAKATIDERCEEAERVLEKLGPEMPKLPSPHVKLLSTEFQAGVLYERLAAEVESELLVCNRGPYAGKVQVDPTVVEALGRGVHMRALYRRAELEDSVSEIRSCAEGFEDAGVVSRVVEELPLSLAVFDRSAVIVALPAVANGAEPFPTNFLVDHPAFASWCVAAFEQLWSSGDALPPTPGPRVRSST